MIGQYLSHTNKRVTVAILQNISKVNKAILSSIHMCMWMHACTSCHVFSDACMHSSREDECQKCHVFSEAVARRRDLCNRKVDANLWRKVPSLYSDENGTDIFRSYSRSNSFRGVQICLYPSLNLRHPIPYPYSNT